MQSTKNWREPCFTACMKKIPTLLLCLISSLSILTAEEQAIESAAGIRLVPIPAGSFLMGSPESEESRAEDEKQTEVTITEDFWMSETEITQAQWLSVTGKSFEDLIGTAEGPLGRGAKLVKEPSARGDAQPMCFVNWSDAKEFCAMLTKQDQKSGAISAEQQYALPTEAQWEYACRAGQTTVFGLGKNTLTSAEANFYGPSPYGVEEKGEYREKTTSAKTFAPNPWGLYDMHGNLYEWCADGYEEQLPGGTDPHVEKEGDGRIIRGGAWDRKATSCRSAYRYSRDPNRRNANIGFRVVLLNSPR